MNDTWTNCAQERSKQLTNKERDEQTKIHTNKQKNIMTVIQTNIQTKKWTE